MLKNKEAILHNVGRDDQKMANIDTNFVYK